MTDPSPGDGPLILALGDSLTAGYGLAAQESFAAQLEQCLRMTRPAARVVNAGVSGDTSADALRRLPRVLASLRQRPALAIVELGANDLMRSIAPARIRANLEAIVEELDRCGIPALLATLEPPPMLAHFVEDYATIYAEVAARFGLSVCPFFPSGVLGHPAMVLADRLHPNAQAISLCARAVLPHVVAALDNSVRRAA